MIGTPSDTCSKITASGELDTLLRTANNNRLSYLTEITTDSLELCRRQFDDTTVIGFLKQSIQDKLTNFQIITFN